MQVPIIIVFIVMVLTIAGFVAISLSLVYVIYNLKLAEKAKDLKEFEKSVFPKEKTLEPIKEVPEIIEVSAFP